MTNQSTHRPSEVLATLKRLGVRVAVTVPDSWLSEILLRIESEPEMSLIRATHEEEALAISCGSRLGGVRTVLIVQNAGLLSMGSGMVCLAQRYQFPLLILASYRGTADDLQGERGRQSELGFGSHPRVLTGEMMYQGGRAPHGRPASSHG